VIPQTVARRGRVLAVLCVLVGAFAVAPSASEASLPLRTAIADVDSFISPQADLAFQRTRATGATAVRFFVSWRQIAPGGTTKPAGFDSANPADPHYDWSGLDRMVRSATAAHLDPILSIFRAPDWAEGPGEGPTYPGLTGTVRPDPTEYGRFASAAAKRYSGQFGGLPRVRYFQAWNEPNLFANLNPQFDTPLSQPLTARSRPLSGNVYFPMVNAFAAGVHAVHRDNLVIAGGLAPFARFGVQEHGLAPLTFMRQMLCMTAADRPQRGCRRRSSFDVWAMDPYTQGSPEHHARFPGNVSIPELPKMRHLLLAAARAGRIASRGAVRFWVLEISWDTNPPDPHQVPLKLHARWVAEGLYRMWSAGVSLVAWFQLRDAGNPNNLPDNAVSQSGLYFRCAGGLTCDTPKPALAAFKFPFVAYRSGRTVLVWGRTPGGVPGTVTVEQQSGQSWRRLARLRADRNGIFTSKLSPRRSGDLRATMGGTSAVPFSLHVPRDFPVAVL